jgi:hypothetical protein
VSVASLESGNGFDTALKQYGKVTIEKGGLVLFGRLFSFAFHCEDRTLVAGSASDEPLGRNIYSGIASRDST